MSDRMALKIAIDLVHVPSQVRLVRSEPLPDGVLLLLRIAAGDEGAEFAGATLMDRPRDLVRRAATFFLEQILFAPNADSYQVLGAGPEASASELRRNVALLLRWLHPDLDPRGERSVFIGRVTGAWNNLKTPERRAAYDKLRLSIDNKNRAGNDGGKEMSARRGRRRPFAASLPRPDQRGRAGRSAHGGEKVGFLRRALSAFFGRPRQ